MARDLSPPRHLSKVPISDDTLYVRKRGPSPTKRAHRTAQIYTRNRADSETIPACDELPRWVPRSEEVTFNTERSNEESDTSSSADGSVQRHPSIEEETHYNATTLEGEELDYDDLFANETSDEHAINPDTANDSDEPMPPTLRMLKGQIDQMRSALDEKYIALAHEVWRLYGKEMEGMEWLGQVLRWAEEREMIEGDASAWMRLGVRRCGHLGGNTRG
ncbi:hypothetical protein EJ08DRAFT_704312 [Tothia fuscella]|uniref:Uncharacterized protein n=1 Tax=Tothia fuscella TaxID=1048955 RepID=A0A9P4P598_9PEZI|nr:hypothetical protein EJ08DRAFT_704312 [Tothia fuscella]